MYLWNSIGSFLREKYYNQQRQMKPDAHRTRYERLRKAEEGLRAGVWRPAWVISKIKEKVKDPK